MKNYLLNLVCISLFFLFSCSEEKKLDDFLDSEEQKANLLSVDHTISTEDAISELNVLLSMIDSQAANNGLRSSKKRTIKNIEPINHKMINSVGSSLRSINFSDDNLVYLVNFKNNEGYAILAADDRIPSSVIAITDDGNIDSNDFINGDYFPFDNSIDYGYEVLKSFSLYNSDEDDYYVAQAMPAYSLVWNYAEDAVGGGPAGGSDNTRQEVGNWVNNRNVAAKLETVWYQSSPFNDKTPKTAWCPILCSAKRGPTGCVAVALAQIMAYHEYPRDFKFNNVSLDWRGIKNISNISNRLEPGTSTQRAQVAELLYHIAKYSRTIFTPDWAFAMPKDAAAYLSIKGGYSGIGMYGYNENKIIDMLNKDNPVFIASISGVVSGHAWVIDGYIDRSRTIREINISTGAIQSSRNESELLVHCNWGWQGKCNGYYVSGVFNTKKEPSEREDYESNWVGTGSKNFTWAFHVMTYNHPN